MRPDLPSPTPDEARLINQRLAVGKRVVEIPGYLSFADYTRDFADLIQKKLEQWQLVDGFLLQQWIRGLSGHWSLPTEKLKTQLLKIYSEVEEKNRITWVMLQVPGVASHAWLIVRMAHLIDGFLIEYIDSNHPGEIRQTAFHDGMESLETSVGPAVPYIGRTGDFARIAKAQTRYCAAVSQTGESPGFDAQLDDLEDDLGAESLDNALD
jgi:hypothetical protein